LYVHVHVLVEQFELISSRSMRRTRHRSMSSIKRHVTVSPASTSSHCSRAPHKVAPRLSTMFAMLRYLTGHIAGGFARHRFDLRGQMEQPATVSSQTLPKEQTDNFVENTTVINGAVQPFVYQIHHQAQASTSSQPASVSTSGTLQ
jgi:hypothetical protein